MKASSDPPTDTPEDVLGGIRQALALNWRAEIRMLVFIGDAPCHGRDYYEAPLSLPVSLVLLYLSLPVFHSFRDLLPE